MRIVLKWEWDALTPESHSTNDNHSPLGGGGGQNRRRSRGGLYPHFYDLTISKEPPTPTI